MSKNTSHYYYLPLKNKKDVILSYEDISMVFDEYSQQIIYLDDEMLAKLRKRSDFSLMINRYYYILELRKILASCNKLERAKMLFFFGYTDILFPDKISKLDYIYLKKLFRNIRFNKINTKTLDLLDYLRKKSTLPTHIVNILDFIYRDCFCICKQPENTTFQSAVLSLI